MFRELIDRVVDLVLYGPRCQNPDCGHDAAIHSSVEGVCLGAVHDGNGDHVGWCECTWPNGKAPKAGKPVAAGGVA
jgi:hypothetical protein